MTPETTLQAELSTHAPRVSWATFLAKHFVWRSGEHVGMIGPTGQGKTTAIMNLLPLHRFTVAFATKPRDASMEALISSGYIRLDRWRRGMDPVEYPRRVIWPDATSLESTDIQREVFADAFARIYREGGWTLALDETWYMDQMLNLGKQIKLYLLQARSLNISLVSATQRPAWVPRELYTSCTHLFFWRTNDETDLNSLSGIGFSSARLIREAVSALDQFQMLYINTRTGRMYRTKIPEGFAK